MQVDVAGDLSQEPLHHVELVVVRHQEEVETRAARVQSERRPGGPGLAND